MQLDDMETPVNNINLYPISDVNDFKNTFLVLKNVTCYENCLENIHRLRSHGNDIVPLSCRYDFSNEKVDCSHWSGPSSYQF